MLNQKLLKQISIYVNICMLYWGFGVTRCHEKILFLGTTFLNQGLSTRIKLNIKENLASFGL